MANGFRRTASGPGGFVLCRSRSSYKCPGATCRHLDDHGGVARVVLVGETHGRFEGPSKSDAGIHWEAGCTVCEECARRVGLRAKRGAK
jgi:hypothetical protein